MSKALDTQVGGNHYKNLAIQPVEYIFKNNLGYFEGCVIKYVTRWKDKGGVQDLLKAKHFLELLIELQEQHAKAGLLSLVEKELADCPDTEVEIQPYRYLILADKAEPTKYYVGKFDKSDAEKYYPRSLMFYTRGEAEGFIRANQSDFNSYPYFMAFYQYGEDKRQFYLARSGLGASNA